MDNGSYTWFNVGRKISEEHVKGLVERWVTKLEVVLRACPTAASKAALAASASDLTIACGQDPTSVNSEQEKRFAKAAKALQQALTSDPPRRHKAKDVGPNLHTWICDYLIHVGPLLLVEPKLRADLLAQQRDGTRRFKKRTAGVRPILVSLPQADLVKLKQIQAEQKAGGLSATVATLIRQWTPLSAKKSTKKKTVNPNKASQPTLL